MAEIKCPNCGQVFKADEALKSRTHDAEQKGLDRASSEKIAHKNNETQKYVSNNAYNASIFNSKAQTSKEWNDAMTAAVAAGQAEWVTDKNRNRVTDRYGRYMVKNAASIFQ